MDLDCPAYHRAMARVLEQLTEHYRDGFEPAEVAAVVARGRASLEVAGKHAEFIPALVDHWAKDELLVACRI